MLGSWLLMLRNNPKKLKPKFVYKVITYLTEDEIDSITLTLNQAFDDTIRNIYPMKDLYVIKDSQVSILDRPFWDYTYEDERREIEEMCSIEDFKKEYPEYFI